MKISVPDAICTDFLSRWMIGRRRGLFAARRMLIACALKPQFYCKSFRFPHHFLRRSFSVPVLCPEALPMTEPSVVGSTNDIVGRRSKERFDEHFRVETVCGFLTNDPGDIYSSSYDGAISCLDYALASATDGSPLPQAPSNETKAHALAVRAADFANFLMRIASSGSRTKKNQWDSLQKAAMLLQEDATKSNALSVACVFAVLTLCEGDASRASASAIASTVSRKKPLRHEGYDISRSLLRTVLVHAAFSYVVRLHIATHFARGFGIGGDEYAQKSADAIKLCLEGIEESASVFSETDVPIEVLKERVSGALAFAVQVPPWPFVAPVSIVEAATPLDFWHGAELVCKSAAKYKAQRGEMWQETTKAVHALIDCSVEGRLYRRADSLATSLYECGGKDKFAEARFLHACDTIDKVLAKRQFPIIERQAERVDKAMERVKGDGTMQLMYGEDIRAFAISRLEEEGEVDTIYRLAELWGRSYAYDEKAIQAAAAARREKYIQWNDYFHDKPPDLISSPSDLISAFKDLYFVEDDGQSIAHAGFDAEWEEDMSGAAVLQISSMEKALLLDIPALSMTVEGAKALEQTVGRLFNSPTSIVAGFGCRQDLSRLRSSPKASNWLQGFNAVVDIQELVGQEEPKLRRLGLSRVCEHYLGKPLDKSEQCSQWSNRPLSERQRAYAALDAFCCVKILSRLKSSPMKKVA